jgi:DNA-binding winged helix-turn-helix (wHTH) protein
MKSPLIFEFGPFRLDTERRVLLRGIEIVPLRPKAVELLLVLVENRDRVVGKEELMRRLWPDTVVEENNLTVQKSALVAALGGDYIQTVPRRGYRFAAKVREGTAAAVEGGRIIEAEANAAAPATTPAAHGHGIGARPQPVAEAGGLGASQFLRGWKALILAAVVALTAVAGVAFVLQRRAGRADPNQGQRVQVRSPSDEAEVMRVVKESQMFETLEIYRRPESFDRGQLARYWLPPEKGGKAVAPIEAAVARLLRNGWRYADESRLELFDFRYVRIFSPRDYAEVGTSERWFVPTVRADGSRVENRNVYLGVYDVDYTLRKVEGRWLLEENSTPRPTSSGNQNK